MIMQDIKTVTLFASLFSRLPAIWIFGYCLKQRYRDVEYAKLLAKKWVWKIEH